MGIYVKDVVVSESGDRPAKRRRGHNEGSIHQRPSAAAATAARPQLIHTVPRGAHDRSAIRTKLWALKEHAVTKPESQKKGEILEDLVAMLHVGAEWRVETRVQVPVDDGSSRTREIDVLLSGEFAGYPVRIAIECKNINGPVSVGLVGEFRDKLDELRIPHQYGIFVATNGYTSEAKARAKKLGMRTLSFDGLDSTRIGLEVYAALQSVVFLLPRIVKWTMRNHASQFHPQSILYRDPRGNPAKAPPAYTDVFWVLWLMGKLPQGLGHHSVTIPMPEGWDWAFPVATEGPEDRRISVEYQVLGLIMKIEGTSTIIAIGDEETQSADRLRAHAVFEWAESGSVPVTVVTSDEELELQQQMDRLGLEITQRVPLPRIQINEMFWPMSETAWTRYRAALGPIPVELPVDQDEAAARMANFDWSSLDDRTVNAAMEEPGGRHPATDPGWLKRTMRSLEWWSYSEGEPASIHAPRCAPLRPRRGLPSKRQRARPVRRATVPGGHQEPR